MKAPRRLSWWGALLLAGCAESVYQLPSARPARPVAATVAGPDDPGDQAAFRAAEAQCRAGLSPMAVSAAFRAVDAVADALADVCTIGIVRDDPLFWHVWCGADATFRPGHYLSRGSLDCGGARAENAFACIGTILSRHLHGGANPVTGVEVISIGSVDHQPLAEESSFLAEPCPALQESRSLPAGQRWAPPTEAEPPDEAARATVWNVRLSWCRAAFALTQFEAGLPPNVRRTYRLGAVGAGTDWLDRYVDREGRACPTPAGLSGEHLPGQCRDARRVDFFVRIKAQPGQRRAPPCRLPEGMNPESSAAALYCYADCRARAAVGRDPQGFSAPHSRDDLLFGAERRRVPAGWLAKNGSRAPINWPSVRELLHERDAAGESAP